MNFAFLSAEAEPVADGLFGGYSLIILVVVMVGLYFIMTRPQKKREKQATEMRNSIEVGDEVTTIGGIVGRVVFIKEDTFVLETAGDRSRMRFKRWAIQEVNKLDMDSGSAKTEPATPERKTRAEKKAEKKAAEK